MALIIISLIILGLAGGSFVNALVWRLREQQKTKAKKPKTNLSIINGRSVCVHCRHRLAWYDLIPLVSWLSLRGKCRYCRKPIEDSPIVELVSALVFVGSYIFWPLTVNSNGQWLLLAIWLVCSVGLLGLAIYDLRWMLLPSRIIYPALAVAVAGRLTYLIAFEPHKWHALVIWIGGVAISSGIFWLLYMISQGRWIGYGDVRLGLLTGTLLASPSKSLLMIFLASVMGTLVMLPALASRRKNLASRLPFGPFLIAATALVVVFGSPILNWYSHLFGL